MNRAFIVLLALSAFVSAFGAKVIRLDAGSSAPGVYRDAVEALRATDGLSSAVIIVSPGVYWLDDPDDPSVRSMPDNSIPYAVTLTCDTLEIRATDPDPVNTVFAVNRGQTRGAVGNYTMLHFLGKSLTVKNMTLGNYCNVDLVYPRNPSLGRQRRCTPIVQAQIGICDCNSRVFADNCRFISRLNLCPLVGARRSYYRSCHFESTDDALTGSGVYEGCHFDFYSSKPFYNTDVTGAVLLNCDIDLKGSSTQYFTKVPGMVTVIDTRFHSTRPVTLQWTRDDSPTVCYQSGVTLNGSPVTIDAARPWLGVDLTSKPLLAAYRLTDGDRVVYNTFNLLAGDDYWDPAGVEPLVRRLERTSGRRLTRIPVRLDYGRNSLTLRADGDSDTIVPRMLLWGGYPFLYFDAEVDFPMSMNWKFPTVVSLALRKDGMALLTSHNTFPDEVTGRVEANYNYGWRGVVDVTVAACLRKAPAFSKALSLTVKKGIATVDYRLDGKGDDRSVIMWRRDSVPVMHGTAANARRYRLSAGDTGHRISVTVEPRWLDSETGQPVSVPTHFPIAVGDVSRACRKPERGYSTDFSDIPVKYQPIVAPGLWTFDSYKPADTEPHVWTPDPAHCWYYGKATDAATGTGLVQWTKGARAFYTPAARVGCRDMTATLVLEPAKSAGQGFGSATAQYFDVYVKYDPVTRTGYGVRIERTVDYDKAVVFTLMHWRDGVATPLSAPVASSCYRTVCTLSVGITDGVLSAGASTTAPLPETMAPGVVPEVSLNAAVPDVEGPATFGMQHTGSTGASATLVSKVTLSWD